MSTREKAIEALQDLPETVSWTEIEERIRFLAAIERGRNDIRDGKVVAHDDVKAAFTAWTTR